jgi:hypothetical protein
MAASISAQLQDISRVSSMATAWSDRGGASRNADSPNKSSGR